MSSELLSLVKYNEKINLCKNFEYILQTGNIKLCITELMQENKKRQKEITKNGYFENFAQYWTALFYKQYILHNQYNNIFDVIHNILLNINIHFLFNNDEKIIFCCKTCNTKINGNTIIKNMKKNNNICKKCNKQQAQQNKIAISEITNIEI